MSDLAEIKKDLLSVKNTVNIPKYSMEKLSEPIRNTAHEIISRSDPDNDTSDHGMAEKSVHP